MGRLSSLDAVTIDAYGTLVSLVDPVPPLRAALAGREVERSAAEVEAAFRAEAEFYRERTHEKPLEALRRRCVAVFLEAARADLDVAEFTPAFIDALRFEPLPGVVDTIARLRALGLALAVVSNWDETLPERLEAFDVDVVVSSAEAGASKPDPAVFRLALERLGVRPERALHVGDSPADQEGARAAGMRFAPAPLAEAFG
ncbi:MAG TPA: HAD-IA family hydrolase [Gaiellaceae bacterium]